ELQMLAAKGIQEIRVLDRTFNLPQERGAALLRMFREEFPQIRFHLELHPQFLGEDLRSELEKALPGQLHIEVGIQCLDADVQRLSGRNSRRDAVLDGLDFLCKQKTFETHADLLAGLPGQTWEHITRDAATLMLYQTAEIQLEILKVLPGTPMREIAPAHGICYCPDTPYDVMKSETMTVEEIQQVRALSRLLDLTYNHKALHLPVLTMSRECPDFILRLLNHFQQTGGTVQTVWNLQKRFFFLLDFCRKYSLKQGAISLAYHWLLAGFPPGEGPDVYSRKADNIPENAVLHSGSADCLTARETRCWQLPMNGEVIYLAYNRAFAPNRPAAIWIAPE
ncbi:MAG: radical SAM protein, partial [Lentisphaeria bacterium]|nr:radical SAM protein [Lentisphaeria bacterium]